MPYTETREDGTVVTTYSPSKEMVEAYPSYTEWKQFMTSHADIPQIDDDGTVKLVCICCGIPWNKLDMSRIRIGGLVRFTEEEETAPLEAEIRTKLKPISAMGLGCPACQSLYFEQIKLTSAENKAREKVNLLKARLAVNESRILYLETGGGKGYKPVKYKSKSMLEPWVDVFEPGWRDD
jgi:hypothetical protein